MDNLYVPFFDNDGMNSLKLESSGRVSVDITAPAHRMQDFQNDKKKVNPRISTRSDRVQYHCCQTMVNKNGCKETREDVFDILLTLSTDPKLQRTPNFM